MWKWIFLVGMFAAVQTPIAHAQTFSSTINGVRSGEWFGTSILGNMLLDGDGLPDFLVGAIGANVSGTAEGKVYVFSGANLQLIRTLAGQSPPDAIVGNYFGFSLANLGDINADGVSDILVGAPGAAGGSTSGFVRFFSGDDGVTLGVVTAGSGGTLFGSSVSSLNDVTGDGIRDAVATEPTTSSGNTDFKGYRISGATSHTTSQFTIGTPPWGGDDGEILTGIADVDGDTYDDILVVSSVTFHAAFRLFSGDSLTPISGVCFDTGTFPSCTGVSGADASVLRLNDVNQDGVGDFAVALPSGLTGTGIVKIYSGADRSVHRTLSNRSLGDMFGSSLANMGDLDGDNADDILVGAVAHTGSNQHNGYVRAFSGRTGQILFTIEGQDPNGQFGFSVGNAGDLNADGVNDVLIGEIMFEPNGSNPGRVHIYFSPPSLAAEQCIYQHIGNAIVCM